MDSESGVINFFINGHFAEAPNSCAGCSACCQFCGEPPFSSDEEINNLPSNLRDKLIAHFDNIRENDLLSRGAQRLPCLWLNTQTGRCKNYNYRPAICYNFAIGGAQCLYFINKVEEGT